MNNFAVWDIEAKNWNELLLVGYYDGTAYQEFFSIKDFVEFIVFSSDTPPTVFAHFGGIYDHNFIFDLLFSENSEYLKPDSFILQGKKTLKFSLINQVHGGLINFVDSSGLFPFSLDHLTKSFNVEHKKKVFDFDNMILNEELREYCYYDCKGLFECLEIFFKDKYIGGVGMKLTRSSISLAVYKKFFNDSLPKIPEYITSACRPAYLGGRTEIFKPLFREQKDNLKCYDLNSLYPAAMEENAMPGKYLGFTYEFDPDSLAFMI